MKHLFLISILGLFLSLSSFGQDQKIKASKEYKEIATLLDSIHRLDQQYREESQELQKTFAWESEEVQKLWQKIHRQDSINLMMVEAIIDKYGWLGPDEIGEKGNMSLFLVVQHADLATQEKYLPTLRAAVDHGKASASDWALMQDRVLMRKGEKQIYGSQMVSDPYSEGYQVYAMIDPDQVDERRAEVGLDPMSKYLKFWDMIWDVEAFKKRMEAFDLKKNKD